MSNLHHHVLCVTNGGDITVHCECNLIDTGVSLQISKMNATWQAVLSDTNKRAYEQGQRDMLAKCIETVEYLHDYVFGEAYGDQRAALWKAVTALRALQEKP